jgi:alanyl-tRNA synthetase
VQATGEIGYFRIVAESSVGAGLRRVEAVTGRGAEDYIERHLASLQGIAHALDTSPEEAESRLAGVVAELDKEKKLVASLQKELSRGEASSLLDKVRSVNGVNLLSARVEAAGIESMREMSDFVRDRLGSAVIVLGAVNDGRPVFIAAVTPDLVEKGYNAGDIVKRVAQVAGGGGGGRPNFAQAGGKDAARVDEALQIVEGLIK